MEKKRTIDRVDPDPRTWERIADSFNPANAGIRERSIELLKALAEKRIARLSFHAPLELTPARLRYRAHFHYQDPDGREVYERMPQRDNDVRQPDLLRLWPHYGPGLLRLTRRDRKTHTTIVKQEIPGKDTTA